ncbi:hypothetical protein GJAV_G00266920 [Gymnothorax javanicus]|nr:hypothetical protein GJAV_G00266920 [Gymnothorax javanicus]
MTMDKLRDDILILCQKYPQGLPLLKIPLLFRAMYKKPLDLCPDELLQKLLEAMADDLTLECTQEGLVVRPAQFQPPSCESPAHSSLPCNPGQASAGVFPVDQTSNCDKGAVLQQLKGEVLWLLRSSPGGVELSKLRRKYREHYGRKLTLPHYGLRSMHDLLQLLGDQVCLELVNNKNVLKEASSGNRVQDLTDSSPGRSGPGLRPSPRKKGKKMEEASLEVLELLKQHPQGVPIKKLANAFNQKYKRNLVVSQLGFSSIEQFLESLGDEVLVERNVVFHRSHVSAAGGFANAEVRCSSPVGAAPFANGSAEPLSSNLASLPSNPAPGQKELTEEQLLNNVQEVKRIYPPACSSLAQLQNGYFLQFHSQLPLEQYMSLCEKHARGRLMPAAQANTDRLLGALGPPVRRAESPVGACSGQVQPAAVSNGVTNAAALPAARTPLLLLPAHLSSADFPSLGTKLSREQERRLKQSSGSSAPVFREAYRAQERETHRAAMQALDVLESESEAGHSRRRRVTVEEANSLAENFIRDIAAEGELVTAEKVCFRICQILHIPSLRAAGIKPEWQLSAVKDLLRTIREVNLYIESVEAVQSVCTLYELGQGLASLKNRSRFEELNLGPLCKIPLVHKMFKVDCNTKDDAINQIETVDILRSLRDFKRRLRGEKVDLAEFLKHLADQYSCESPYDLGVRIQSVALSVSTLSKAMRTEHAAMDKARTIIQDEIEEEVLSRMRKVKKNVLEAAQVPAASSAASVDLRRKYVSLTAAEVVLEVFKHAREVFTSRMAKHVQDFLMRVTGDRLATALFQLAICGGSLAVPQDLVAKESTHKPAQETNTEEQKSTTPPPSEAAVMKYLQECMVHMHGVPSLPYMSRLEKKVTEHFGFGQFSQLAQGTFLEFLVKPGISQILQEAGGGALVLSSQDAQPCGFKPSRQDVFEFIRQCGVENQDKIPFIESALRSHYRIRDCRDLGYGPLSNLVSNVIRQKQLSDTFSASPVRYESPLFVRDSRGSAEEKVGLLGPVSRDDAVAILVSAPLLEDLAEWANWELVFEPQHGPLKDFMERHCASQSGLAALEVRPGVLLRISTCSDDKLFAEASRDLDPVGTAGHLVSIVVAHGIVNAPAALLANHMESSLAPAVTEEEVPSTEDPAGYTRVAKFILDCLVRIPTRICKAFLQQVFLEPLYRVLGQAKSKAILLQTARLDSHYRNRLHHMGLLLGMTEWVKDFQSKLSPPNRPEVPSLGRKPQAAESVSSKSSLVDFSEDEDFLEKTRLQPPSSSETSSLSFTDHDDDEEQKYELVQNTDASADEGITEACRSDAEEGRSPEAGLEEAEPAGNEEEDRLSMCRAIIDDIRKTEFGIGVELNEEVEKLMKVQQERQGRSLQRLSDELYSKTTHFVLELIQNADDNSYPSNWDDQPALAFVLEKDCVTVLNNESGFEERNIRAICDVARTTKGKHKYGYIGQKGIGFKSVFKVTDCPEIRSNGFHIRFDKNSGPMGYILPHWLEEDRPVCADLPELKTHSWTTKISLPLRSESYQTRNLFQDVHPSLLLFLHRLRSITIVNQEKRLVSMTRRDLSHDILEVQHTEGVERWLVVKRTLHPKMIKDGVESTELALAFKLSDSAADLTIQPEKQPVFAFLPLRSFGFRFIIQGDFDIPSSREDVDRDSYWNQWLRSEIPQLFLHAMDTFAEHPEFSGLQGLCHFLQYIPLPDEILDFFNPVAGQIIQLIKGKACLPTKESEDGSVEYKLPSQIAVSADPLLQDVIGPEDLRKHLGLSYLHPSLQSALPSSLVSALGVRRLRATDVAAVTCAIAKDLADSEGTLSDSGLKKVAQLLVCNFRALDQEYGEADAILKALKDIPIIPLADGQRVALSGGGIFFPLVDENRSQSGIEAIYRDLKVVAPRLLDCLDPLGNSQVKELLKRLEVHQLEPHELLHKHIYPVLKSGAWKSKPEDIVVRYVVFIKQNSRNQDYSTLNAVIPVLTNKGFLCPTQSKVQFSKDYGNIDLPQKLPGVDWVLLDSCYLRVDKDLRGWREFFSHLGVHDLLIFRKEKRTMSSRELASSPWAPESELWPRTADGLYVLEDHECEEFRALVTADKLPDERKRQQRLELLRVLEQNWVSGDRYAQYENAMVLDSEGRRLRDVKSSFFHFLTGLPWVPADRPRPWRSDECSVEYLRPNATHLFSPELHRLLGIHVSYVKMDPSEFTSTVGMKSSITVEEMIEHLTSWCTKASEDGEDFVTTVEHIHSVYTYLSSSCNMMKLKDLFQKTAAVFVEFERKEHWCSGKFYMLKEVCWNDPTGMFVRYKDLIRKPDGEVQEPKVLAPFYGQLESMQEFFLKILCLESHPSMKQYVDLLELICDSWSLPNVELLQDVSVIYAKLAEKCKTTAAGEQEQGPQLNPSYCTSLKTMLSDKRVFPTKDNRWVSLAQRPLISDSLEKFFKKYSEICLLNLPQADKRPVYRHKPGFNQGKLMSDRQAVFSESDRALFLQICEVKTLSQCVTVEAQTENYRPCPPLQAQVRKVVPYVQKFLFHHEEFCYMYDQLKDNEIAQRIKTLSFGQVGKLYRVYRLSLPEERFITEQEDVICLLKDNKEFYIQKDYLSAKLDISRELAKLFSSDSQCHKELEAFLLGLLTSLDDEGALRRFVREKEIKELPDSEEKWEVPEPVATNPEPPVFSRTQFSRSASVAAEEPKDCQEDGERTLASWPPKSSFHQTPGSHTGKAVEAVLKMWPPPAQPASGDGETTPGPGRDGRAEPPLRREPGIANPQGSKPSCITPTSTDKNQETAVRPSQYSDTKLREANESSGAAAQPDVTDEGEKRKSEAKRPDAHHLDKCRPAENTAAPEQPTPRSSHPLNSEGAAAPEVVSTSFQGNGNVQRPLLALDNPVWAKELPPQTVLEDLVLDCSRPNTVVFSEDPGDTMSIGEWGEQLVNAFLTHWKESGTSDSPREIIWYNSDGETGRPCDFKITFGADGDGADGCQEIFVEVKSTIKAEKHFIHLSANELDLALKERDRYHIYRVYNAGDSQNVRLCRIKNLAQHLHSKDLKLFLFV